MTYDEFMSAINSDVERILSKNSANIAQSLLQGCRKTNLAYQKNNYKSSEMP